jgi:ATP-binding cassette subfamily B protein
MKEITNAGIDNMATLTVRYILRVGIVYFVLRIIDSLAHYYMAYTGHVMGTKIETDMRRDAYAHLHKLSDTYFNNTKIGQIMGRITNDLFDVTEFSHHCPEEFLIAGVKGIVSFAILLNINIVLTLIIFVIIPVMVLICGKINHKMRATFREQRVVIGELNARIEDSLLGQKVVKAFAN